MKPTLRRIIHQGSWPKSSRVGLSAGGIPWPAGVGLPAASWPAAQARLLIRYSLMLLSGS